MKPRIPLFTVLLACCLVWACSKEQDDPHGGRVPVRLSAATVATKLNVDGTQWLTGDSIGVYMKKAGEPIAPENVLEDVANRPFRVTASTGEMYNNSLPTLYYPGTAQVDFIAYYTHRFTQTLNASNVSLPVDVGSQARYLYVLYSDNAKGVDRNSGRVTLEFRHILSRAKFLLVPGEGAPDITGATLSISGLIPKGSFNLSDASWDYSTERKEITLLNPTPQTSETHYTGILIPQSAAGCRLNVILTNSEKYSWDFPESNVFEAGKEHKYTITVSKTGIAVTPGNITIWEGTDDPVISGEAKP